MAAAGISRTDRGAAAVTIRLLLADDQELVRSALCALLDLEDDFEVVASIGRGDEVAQAALANRPDVALLDIEMPGLDGLAAAAVLAAQVPACRVVILTTFGRAGYLRRAMEAGAAGFVVKDAPAEVLASAIRRVMSGERVIDPVLAASTLAAGESPLTGRERDVLGRVAFRLDRRRYRRQALPLRRYRPQLPLRRHHQDRHPKPHRGLARRRRARLAINKDAAERRTEQPDPLFVSAGATPSPPRATERNRSWGTRPVDYRVSTSFGAA